VPDFHIPETEKIILSVNDSPTMEQPMFQWYYENGVALVRARSTSKAMEMLARAQFNAVVTNLHRFENGKQNDNAGIELTQQIRRSGSHIPVFIYTMNIDQATRDSALASGAVFITTNPSELQSMLKKHL
jgi:CheY-like chemotaxis protein